MTLPDNVERLAASFTKLPEERKRQVLQHLAQSNGQRGNAVVAELLKQGGPEGEFVQHIFGKDLPGRTDSPANKKVNPVNIK